jgi:hypothetical protein
MNKANAVVTMDQREAVTSPDRSLIDVQASRAVAEVQASMAIAKKFPRDEKSAFSKIMQACSRKSLAEVAVYEYPRGGEKVRGPSIRMAEAIAQSWGNIATGIVELDRRDGESLAMAYCVDLETNYRKDVTFAVPHIRDTKQGGKALTETRDIYELVANMGSRRLRNCIMAVIPGDIFDAAESKCMETLTKDEMPIQDRIREALAAFGEYGVSSEMIAAKFSQKVESLSPQQLAKLRGIYQSLKDGVGSVKDFFEVAPQAPSRTEILNQEAPQKAAFESPKLDPKREAQSPSIKQDADQDNFNNFSGSLFGKGSVETIETIQVEVFNLVGALKYTPEQFNQHVSAIFKKSPQNLNIAELKRLRDRYKTEIAQMQVK